MKLSILSELFSECWWWLFFWMLLSFILGWLLSKIFRGDDGSSSCCEELKDLEAKYRALLAKNTTPVRTVPEADTASGIAAAPVAKGTAFDKLKNDNLQIIEGIGPKMNEILHKHGIVTWSDLAAMTPAGLRELLDKENPTRYKIINPATWPEQAALARDGKWEELINMQKDLNAQSTGTEGLTDSKLEKMMIKLGLLKRWKKDDLKAIEGIGPKIEKLLKENGIDTWEKLSQTSTVKLKEILESAGSRFQLAFPETWPKQASLAAQGKWDALEKYQNELLGGR